MRKLSLWVLVVAGVVGVLLTGQGRCDLVGPGTYYGYYGGDRWGRKVFYNGPGSLFVGDEAARTLEPYAGRPLEIEVTELSQPMNPGAGLIVKVREVSVVEESERLALTIRAGKERVLPGEGVSLELGMENRSAELFTFMPGVLSVVLVTDSPFQNSDIGYQDPEDRAYWYYQETYLPLTSGGAPTRVACRDLALPWSGEYLVSKGKGIRPADENRGTRGPLVVEPGGRFEDTFVVGKELLPDDYEVFFSLSSGSLSSIPGPMSPRVWFDVVAGGEGKADAETDIRGGTCKHYVIGQPMAHDRYWREILSESGIEMVSLGCTPEPDERKHAEEYNAVMVPHLKKGFGEDFLSKTEEEAKRRFVESRRATIEGSPGER